LSTKVNSYTGLVEHSQGDDFTYSLALSGYTLATGDSITLSIKKFPTDNAYVVPQVLGAFVDGSVNAIFTISASNFSAVTPGDYVYDILLVTSAGATSTIQLGTKGDLGPYKFVVKGVVHDV